MLQASKALHVAFSEGELKRLSPKRLKMFKTACYKKMGVFYCESCRELHVETDKEKKEMSQLRTNLNLISKVQKG